MGGWWAAGVSAADANSLPMLLQSIQRHFYKWPRGTALAPNAAPDDSPNNVKLPEIQEEIGDKNWQRVEIAVAELYRPPNAITRLAISPSPVIRGESEIHGISTPRFAVRAYLKDGGFLHIRRLIRLLRSLPEPLRSGPDELSFRGETYEAKKAFSYDAPFRDQYRSPIADCILPPPIHLSSGFNFIRGDLGRAYGERSFPGIPYVQMLAHFGGAACIQACMLMCSTLVSLAPEDGAYISTIPSPAEMGVEGEERATRGWHGFVGLFIEDAITCLSGAGYRAAYHATPRGSSLSADDFAGKLGRLIDAQVPTICLVASSVLWSIRKRPWYKVRRPKLLKHHTETNDHAVVVVGVSMDRKWVVVNDPSKRPFTKIESRDLHQASVCSRFCAVYPPGVRLGLFEGAYSGPDENSSLRLGIFDVAKVVQSVTTEAFGAGHLLSDQSIGQFFLGRLILRPNVRFVLPNGLPLSPGVMRTVKRGRLWRVLFPGRARKQQFAEMMSELKSAAEELPARFSGQWVWLHVQDDPIRLSVWRADQPVSHPNAPTIPADPREVGQAIWAHLLAVLQWNAGERKWNHTFVNDRFRRSDLDAAAAALNDSRTSVKSPEFTYDPKVRKPEVSLISSFCSRGFSEAFSRWPAAVRNCDLYAFMHKDADFFGFPRSQVPLDWLADHDSADKRKGLAKRLADGVDRVIQEHGGVPQIRAFATYLPEASRIDPSKAQRALATLVEVARELRTRGHDVRTIEVVAGNRIVGLQPYRRLSNDEIVCFAKLKPEPPRVPNKPPPKIAIVDVLAETIRETGLSRHEQLTFAVELEPGRFFDIRNMERIRALLDAIDFHREQDLLRRIIGLNLDIGHYALAGIKPAEIKPICERIAHIHISDQQGGHLADLSLGKGGLGTKRGISAFEPWLRFVEQCYSAHRDDGVVPLSGLVSLEMEACASIRDVTDSLTHMNRWF